MTRDVVVDAASRLDTFAHAQLGASRQVIARLVRDGAIAVNGRRAAKGDRLRPGDVVTLPVLDGLVPQPDLPVRRLYADADLVVIDKPGGMPSHALDPRQRDTVANWLAAHYPETVAAGDALASGLAHRLDTGTSGVLIAARSRAAFAALRRAFRAREVEKRYRAVVDGVLTAALVLEAPLAHDRGDRRRMTATPAPSQRAWPARTEVTPIAVVGTRSVVEVAMRTGVTHQIRVHLASAGHPVVGDRLYGAADSTLADGRHALHAATVTCRHPTTNAEVSFAAPWPPDLARLWDDAASG